MRRKKIVVAATAVVIGASAALAVYALTRDPAHGETSAITAGHGHDAAEDAGPHGGTLLHADDLTLEVVFTEKPDDARLTVYPSRKGKPLAAGAQLSGTLSRIDGTTENLHFAASADGFTSVRPIAEPHVFDASISVASQGKTTSFAWSRSDGVVALTPEQIQTAGITLAEAGPAEIESTVQVPGEIRFNEDRTAHVVPRVAGIVERVAVSAGERVEKGQLLAVIASTDLADAGANCSPPSAGSPRRAPRTSAKRRCGRSAFPPNRIICRRRCNCAKRRLPHRTRARNCWR